MYYIIGNGELENVQFCRNDSRQLVYSVVDNSGANRPMFSQLDQHGAFTPCCTRSASPFPSASRVAGARPRSFHDLSLFFIPQALLPPSPPLRFCEGLPRDSNGVRPRPSQNRSRLFDRAMKISLWLTLASRVSRNCDPLNRAARTSSPAYRPLFFIIFRCLKSYH